MKLPKMIITITKRPERVKKIVQKDGAGVGLWQKTYLLQNMFILATTRFNDTDGFNP